MADERHVRPPSGKMLRFDLPMRRKSEREKAVGRFESGSDTFPQYDASERMLYPGYKRSQLVKYVGSALLAFLDQQGALRVVQATQKLFILPPRDLRNS